MSRKLSSQRPRSLLHRFGDNFTVLASVQTLDVYSCSPSGVGRYVISKTGSSVHHSLQPGLGTDSNILNKFQHNPTAEHVRSRNCRLRGAAPQVLHSWVPVPPPKLPPPLLNDATVKCCTLSLPVAAFMASQHETHM